MDERRQWDEYAATRDTAARNRLIERYLPLVAKVASGLRRRIPATMPTEDLQAIGAVGLIRAVERFDPGRGVHFSTYATWVIRSTILDSMRAADFFSRAARIKAKQTGRDLPTFGPLPPDIGGRQAPASSRERVRELCRHLPPFTAARTRMIFILRYHDGLTFEQIAASLDLSEARVNQIHGEVVRIIRERQHPMTDRPDDTDCPRPEDPPPRKRPGPVPGSMKPRHFPAGANGPQRRGLPGHQPLDPDGPDLFRHFAIRLEQLEERQTALEKRADVHAAAEDLLPRVRELETKARQRDHLTADRAGIGNRVRVLEHVTNQSAQRFALLRQLALTAARLQFCGDRAIDATLKDLAALCQEVETSELFEVLKYRPGQSPATVRRDPLEDPAPVTNPGRRRAPQESAGISTPHAPRPTPHDPSPPPPAAVLAAALSAAAARISIAHAYQLCPDEAPALEAALTPMIEALEESEDPACEE